MVRWPAPERLSKTSAAIIERFKKVAAAKELEQDPREWVLMNWPWVPDPPYTVVVRASDGAERRFVMDPDGLWTTVESTGPAPRSSAA
jgi:hypothetical protein